VVFLFPFVSVALLPDEPGVVPVPEPLSPGLLAPPWLPWPLVPGVVCPGLLLGVLVMLLPVPVLYSSPVPP
jgi:hypothetical protein